MKGTHTLMSVCLVLFFLTGCTQTQEIGPSPNPDMDFVDDPGEIEPPPAVLAVAGGEQVSGIGSFCWSANSREGGTVRLCADTIGIPTAREPVSAFSPFTAQFQLPIAERPEELSLNITPVTDNDEIFGGTAQWRWWPYRGGTRQALPLEQQPALELSLDPGLYVLRLFARWPELGDVTYGFLMQVQPRPTPTQTPLSEPEDGDSGLPASCLLETESSLLYVNAVDGYCLRYPARFRLDDVYPPGIANLYGPPFDYSLEPVAAGVTLLVEGSIGDLTLSEAVDAWLQRRQASPPTQRVAGVLGDEPAEIVTYLGDRSGARTVFAVYEGKLYALTFYPVDAHFPQAALDVEDVWQTVSDSFAFLPPETRAVDTETTDPPQITFFQATPTEVETGDVVTLTWEASGERAVICPTTRSVLFTSDDCRQVPLSGETMFTIPVEAAESRFVDFILTVEAGGVVSPLVSEVSAPFKCHKTWFFSDEPQPGICPREPVTSRGVAQQFQRGMMIWIEQLGRYIILDQVSSLTGTVRRPSYTVDEPLDIIRDTSGEIATPPVRLRAPEGEFGLVWRGDVSNSPGYRETLGWAVAPEVGYEAIWQCDSGLPPGAWQTCYLQGLDPGLIVFHRLGGWYVSGEQEDTLHPGKLSRSMKGYELYSWQVQGEWYFALVIGTNRIKTFDEIASPEVRLRGLDSLKSKLDQLPRGEQVLWITQRVPNVTLPPGEMIDETRAYCRQRGIELEIEPIDNKDLYLPKTVPVVTVEMASGKAEIIGYIGDVHEKDGHPYISFDEIEWLTGVDAAKAMREDGLCGSSESDCEPPNPFYIRNRDERRTAFRVSQEAAILMQTLSHGPDGNFNWDERIDLDRFRQIFDGDANSHLKAVPCQITVYSGIVTGIREQYVP